MLQIEAKKRRLKKDTEEVAQRIRDLALIFDVRVASGGKVFGSITAKDIAAKLSEAGFVLDRKRVLLTEPLKKVERTLFALSSMPKLRPSRKFL